LPSQERHLDDCDEAILHALADQPLASIRELSRLAHLPKTTVQMGLTESLESSLRYLR
jgi:DNA-binding IclR family transcriptional regulator